MYYDDAAETQILRHFMGDDAHHEAHHDVHHGTSLDAVIDVLRAELEIKNEQIRELNARLAENSAALLAAQQTIHAAQALHAGTMQKHLPDNDADPQRTPGFWTRLFRKK